MSILGDLRAGLAHNLRTIQDVQVSPYVLSQPTPPGIQILPAEVNYHQAFANGRDAWRFTVQAFVAFSSDTGSQVLLDRLIEEIPAALESDPTLNGAASDVVVRGASGYRLLDRAGGGQLILSEFLVDVVIQR